MRAISLNVYPGEIAHQFEDAISPAEEVPQMLLAPLHDCLKPTETAGAHGVGVHPSERDALAAHTDGLVYLCRGAERGDPGRRFEITGYVFHEDQDNGHVQCFSKRRLGERYVASCKYSPARKVQ